jgi:AcrR family transcriptional regulator
MLTHPRHLRRPTAPRPQRRPRSAETIRFILEATDRLRQTDGIHAVSLKRVAAVAGVGIGTVYHHFPDRAALLQESEQRAWEHELATLFARINRIAAEGRTRAPADLAHALVSAAVEGALRRIDSHGVTLDDPLLRDLMFDFFDRVATYGMDLLAAIGAPLRGPDARRRVIMATELVAMMTWVAAIRHRDELASGAFVRELTDLLCRYLLDDSAT